MPCQPRQYASKETATLSVRNEKTADLGGTVITSMDRSHIVQTPDHLMTVKRASNQLGAVLDYVPTVNAVPDAEIVPG